MTFQIKTKRLSLRPPVATDAARLGELLNNFAVSGNLSVVPNPYTLDDAIQWLGRWNATAKPSDTQFVIDLGNEGAIGVIGYRERAGDAHIGYWLGEPYWNRGIMSEALKSVIGWYFGISRDDTITSGVFHFNMPSLAIQQKLGFVETGRSTVHCLARGMDIEHIDTELTRDTFEVLENRQQRPQYEIS